MITIRNVLLNYYSKPKNQLEGYSYEQLRKDVYDLFATSEIENRTQRLAFNLIITQEVVKKHSLKPKYLLIKCDFDVKSKIGGKWITLKRRDGILKFRNTQDFLSQTFIMLLREHHNGEQ